jgi:antitoxin component YwqK of YwqJK toxin-antitoxin module
MKNHIIISLLFLSIGLSQQEYNDNDLIEMDNGLWTEKFSDEPITGKVFGYFGEESNPKKVYIGNVRNGKKEGKWVSYYHSTGKKRFEYNFKNGKEDGLCIEWSENGQKSSEWISNYMV